MAYVLSQIGQLKPREILFFAYRTIVELLLTKGLAPIPNK